MRFSRYSHEFELLERENSDLGEFLVKKRKLGFDYLGVQSGKVEEGVGNSD